MAPSLQILVSKDKKSEIELGSSTTIGRLKQNTISFPDDLLISRQHALIRRQGADDFVLIDLGSSNGTYLNSKLLISPTSLHHGDEILLGAVLFRFKFPEQQVHKSELLKGNIELRTMVGVRVSQVVVMVGDIRNFSRLSELLIPEDLARFLGSWFREVYDIVSESGGVVDKYIGDAFMAYWRVDRKAPSAASRTAITVAMKLLKKVEEMKLSIKEAFNFQIGIGIHEGVVASSNVGGSSQRDSSIMGDAVNTAFRVEATCKELSCPLLLTGEVFDHVSDLFVFTSFGLVLLKGKSEPVTLYGVFPCSP